ncbi:S8 family peptidase [Halogranum rubrum]|nr:S8 family peptidase [Halogranum salarium]
MSEDGTPHMKRRRFLQATSALGLAGAMSGVASATPGRNPGPKDDEMLVGIANDGEKIGKRARKIKRKLKKKYSITVDLRHSNEKLRYVALKPQEALSEKDRSKIEKRLKKFDRVKYVERNETLSSMLTPNDPQYGQQYAPQLVNADSAWDTTLGSSSVTIAVVDTGVQYDHPDLSGSYASNPGYDFADSDSDPYPDAPSDEYHGTHVSGIAGGVTDNGTGTSGISNSTLINGRALDETGRGSTSDIADAVEWAADQGADVINLSLGGGGYTSTMKNAVTYATNQGSLVVAAAGNNGTGSVSYPAAYSECLAVSALDPDESLADYSQYGSEIELAAPGTNVLATTTEARGSYEQLSGTSMATPVVSGVAGLALAQWDLNNAELRDHLKATAVDVGLSSNQQGSGRVDAANAVGTEPGSGGGDGGDGGDGGTGESTTATASGSLSSSYDYDDYSYSWSYSGPSKVVVELDGPSTADFDLYVNTGTTSNASPSNYDYASTSTNSQEVVTIDAPDDSTDLQVDVDSYSGSGSYDLTITEYQ